MNKYRTNSFEIGRQLGFLPRDCRKVKRSGSLFILDTFPISGNQRTEDLASCECRDNEMFHIKDWAHVYKLGWTSA